MFHNISNPKWFGNWSRLEDDYLGNGGTDIADNFTFSKMEKTGGLFGSIVRLATAFPACDPETGHATGAWKVACESIDLDEVPLSDIADMISGFDCETITDFRLFNTGAFDNTPMAASPRRAFTAPAHREGRLPMDTVPQLRIRREHDEHGHGCAHAEGLLRWFCLRR